MFDSIESRYAPLECIRYNRQLKLVADCLIGVFSLGSTHVDARNAVPTQIVCIRYPEINVLEVSGLYSTDVDL
jgi:hypothetical protein